MTTMDADWTTWLGPAAEEMTDEQRDRFEVEAEEVLARFPHHEDELAEREAALWALVQYILGETTLDEVGRERVRTQDAARSALVAAQTVARLAVLDGVPEAEAARRAGIDRMTVRKMLGKR